MQISREFKPVVSMMEYFLRNDRVTSVMANWASALQDGILNFGVREKLNDFYQFNLIISLKLNPEVDKNSDRVVLNIDHWIAGVIALKGIEHSKYQFMKDEIMLIRAKGAWDFSTNKAFKTVEFDQQVMMNMPVAKMQSTEELMKGYSKDISELCERWLLNQKVQPKVMPTTVPSQSQAAPAAADGESSQERSSSSPAKGSTGTSKTQQTTSPAARAGAPAPEPSQVKEAEKTQTGGQEAKPSKNEPSTAELETKKPAQAKQKSPKEKKSASSQDAATAKTRAKGKSSPAAKKKS